MPWYKLPHADMVMHFDQEMDLEPADEPIGMVDATAIDSNPCFVPAPKPFAAGGVFTGPMPKLGDISEVVIPNEPEPEEEAEAT